MTFTIKRKSKEKGEVTKPKGIPIRGKKLEGISPGSSRRYLNIGDSTGAGARRQVRSQGPPE